MGPLSRDISAIFFVACQSISSGSKAFCLQFCQLLIEHQFNLPFARLLVRLLLFRDHVDCFLALTFVTCFQDVAQAFLQEVAPAA